MKMAKACRPFNNVGNVEMAIRGSKPKPTYLRVISPPTGKRRPRRDEAEPVAAGKPERPAYLAGRAAELWIEVVARAPWLGLADSYKLAGWCSLEAQLEEMGRGMLPALIAQWRILGHELGLDPSGRSRLDVSEQSEPDPADRFLRPRQ
jgi:hypothetical protein